MAGACLSDRDLERYHGGELAAARGVEVEAHLSACADCRRRSEELLHGNEALLADLRDLPTSPLPNGNPVAPAPAESGASPSSPLPEQIAGYRITRLIGEGGMGAVYKAEQSKPRRIVALKVIKPGFASVQALKRFEQECQVLGRLQHPGIAQVFEAGMADTGAGPQPYFAMEYIQGQSLTDYAAANRLTIRQRLELLARIADAVQHAHAKGVIHRDLKPANILVTPEGQPKILDFGVARAVDSDIQATTVETDMGVLIGTLPYMSPEQVSGDPDELDTRSDVYALGIILYELLVGRLPYDLHKRMLHEVVRIIREEEPTRLSSVNRIFRGDIETIVGRTLEKDKSRRYQTANAVSADIRRYLNNEPIAARPPSTWYQARKFAARNKALVAGVAATMVALLTGLAGTGLALKRALAAEAEQANQRQRADERAIAAQKAEAAATAARDAEKARADELKQVSDFQSQMLSQIDTTQAGIELMADVRERYAAALEKAGVPEEERTARVDALRAELVRVNATDTAAAMIDRTILKPAVKAIDEQFKNQPLVDAQLRQALATLYEESIGKYDAASPLQERALVTRRRALGNEHPDTLTSVINMGFLLRARGKLAEAEPYYRESLETSRRVLGEEHPTTLTALNNLGRVLEDQNKLAEAEKYYRDALEKRRRVLGEEHADTLGSINNMGRLLQHQRQLAEAETYFREALEKMRRVLGEEHPQTLASIGNMGTLLHDQGKLADAESYYREALEKSRRVRGEEHPDTLTCINDMGVLLRDEGKLAEAEPYYREALEKGRRVLGEEHPSTLTSVNNMGRLLQEQGKLAEAERYYREALEKRRRVLGDDHPGTINSIGCMGRVLRMQGRHAEAEPYYREALEKSRRVFGEDDVNTITSINNMGFLLQTQGKLAEAESYCVEALEKSRRVLGEEHQQTLVCIDNMGLLLLDRGKLTEAEPYIREGLDKSRRVWGEDHPDSIVSISLMSRLLRAQGKLADAEQYSRKALEKSRQVLGEEHRSTLNYVTDLAALLQEQGKHQDAINLIAHNEPAARTTFTGSNGPELASMLAIRGRARFGLGYDGERFKLTEEDLLEAHLIFTKDRGETYKHTLRCAQALLELYTAWDAAEPGKGYDEKAAEWRVKLEAGKATAQSASQPATTAPAPASEP